MTNTLLDYTLSLGEKATIWDRPFSFIPEAESLYSYFRRTSKCPYCRTKTQEVMSVHRLIEYELSSDRSIAEKIHGCRNCGWWIFNRSDIEYDYREEAKRRVAVLREFKIDDKELPLATLKKELQKKPNVLYNIHDKKFEELVASILQDFYQVEVRVIGKRNDGGIDLVYVQNDEPFAIQVKRRLSADKIETVSLIREFLGALILQGFKKGKVVTTATKFSSGAEKTKNEIVQKGLLQEFELIDFSQFVEMFKYTNKVDALYPWEELFAGSLVDWLNIEDTKVKFTGFKNIQKKPKPSQKRFYYYHGKQNGS